MAYGPARGLDITDKLTAQPALAAYAQLPAVRGDLLAKLDRLVEARQEFEREAIVREIVVERADQPVAPAPNRAWRVVDVALRIAVASQIKPDGSPPLASSRQCR